jgi:ribosome-associated protein
MIERCIQICEDRKADNLQVYDVRGESILADYYLFCSGNSTPHITALRNSLDKSFKDEGILPKSIEGTPDSQWVLMDYADVLVHIFHPDTREFYQVEELLDPERRIYPVGDA